MLLDSVGLDLKDIEPKQLPPKSFFGEMFKNLLLIVFFSLVAFVVINLPAYYQIGSYKFSPRQIRFDFPSFEQMKTAYADRVGGKNSESSPKVAAEASATAGATPAASAPDVNQYADNTVFIPKIGVKAPIGWDIASDQISTELLKHVVHVQGSAKPGGKGNVFLTGHSSNYWWIKGDYNTVFALLPQLSKGDEIIITYQGKFFYYKVTSTLEVKPSEVSQYFSSAQDQLTIMTCVPVGTNLKRLLVFASPQQ